MRQIAYRLRRPRTIGADTLLEYVDWFNNRRLHGEIERGPGFITPAAFETAHYCRTVPANPAGTQ